MVGSLICGLGCMICYGVANAMKTTYARYMISEYLFSRSLLASIMLGVAGMIFGDPDHGASISYDVGWHSLTLTEFMIIGLGGFGYLPVLAFIKAMKSGRMGIVSPISGSSPLITVILAALLMDARIVPLAWLGIVAVIAGNIILCAGPVKQIGNEVIYAAIAAFGWGIFGYLLIPAAQSIGPLDASSLVEAGVSLAAWLHLLGSDWRKNKKYLYCLPRSCADKGVIGTAALISIGTGFYTIGVTKFNIGIVAALSNSTALVTVLIGILCYKEPKRLKEILGALVVIGGVAVIA